MKKVTNRVVSTACALALTLGFVSAPKPAAAGVDPYIGDIMIVGFNFCPRGWALADGQLLSVSQYTALFSLLGTQFGGDGRTTFGLPNMQSRAAIGQGSGPGLPIYRAGQIGGADIAVMTTLNMPSHSHTVNANNLDGDKPGPGGKLLAAAPTGGTGNETIYSNQSANVTMNPAMIGYTGQNSPINIKDPFLGLYHCIATTGTFPSRP